MSSSSNDATDGAPSNRSHSEDRQRVRSHSALWPFLLFVGVLCVSALWMLPQKGGLEGLVGARSVADEYEYSVLDSSVITRWSGGIETLAPPREQLATAAGVSLGSGVVAIEKEGVFFQQVVGSDGRPLGYWAASPEGSSYGFDPDGDDNLDLFLSQNEDGLLAITSAGLGDEALAALQGRGWSGLCAVTKTKPLPVPEQAIVIDCTTISGTSLNVFDLLAQEAES